MGLKGEGKIMAKAKVVKKTELSGAAGKKAKKPASLTAEVPIRNAEVAAGKGAIPAAKAEVAAESNFTPKKAGKQKVTKISSAEMKKEIEAKIIPVETEKVKATAKRVSGRKGSKTSQNVVESAELAEQSRDTEVAERIADVSGASSGDVASAPLSTSEPATDAAATLAIPRAAARQEDKDDEPDDGFLALDADLEAEIEEAAVSKKSKKRKGRQNLAASAPPSGLPGDENKPNVLYLARIPHGFYEDQMAGFFGQFGEITRLRLSRNKKTGKSKHFAFIEFEFPEVASIVAECMNNYLLFGSVLQCHLVPREKLHPLTWVGANKKFRKVPWKKEAKELQNKVRSLEEEQRRIKRWLRSDQKRRTKLAAAGIQYDWEDASELFPKEPKHVKFEDKDTPAEVQAPKPAKKAKVNA